VSDIQPELSIRRAALSLSTNYRSTAELVAFFNALFPGVFGEAHKPYEARFSAMLTKKEKHEGVDAVEVYIQEVQRTAAVSDDDTDDEHEQSGKEAGEALAAARRIIDGVKAKQFAFGDIAVLFKSTAHQNEYEKTFRLAGIPFSAADPRGLYCEGPANDMYAILRLALFPMDRNAYATVLRSPFVKLGDESVFRIMLEKPETPFPERYPEKWFPNPAEKARYLHGSDVFNELLAMVDLRGIAPVLAYLWYESGYRSYLLYDPQSRDLLEHFEYLYAMAMDADKRQLSMSAFLDELAPLMGTTEKAATGNIPEQSDTVLFLTVHKSKGLEFPVVIIANAGVEDTTVQKEKQKPYYLDPHWGVTLNLKQDTQPRDKDTVVNSFFDLGDTGKKLVQDMSEAELKRLFYVAATRAEQRLFIFGSRTVTKDEDKALDGMDGEERLAALIRMRRVVGKDEDQRFKQKSFLDLFSLGAAEAKLPPFKLVPCTVPTTDGYTQETARLHEAVSALLSEQEQASLTEERLTVEQFYRIPARVEPRSRRVTTTPTLMEAYNRALHPEHYMRGNKLDDFACERFLLVEDKRIIPINESVELLEETAHSTETMRLAFGKLCHHIIETFLSGVIASDDEAALQVYAEEAVRTLFPESARDHSGAFAKEALIVGRRFMASATGRDAAAAKNRRAEYPFLLPLRDEAGCVLVRGAIDLIYEHEGHCVIIDFKTDKQFNPATHTVQLACYARAAAAFSSLPVKTALVYLREQDLVAHEFAPDMNDAELVALTCVSAL
jgi:ATP-dependent helicase/nuclease subunit A